MRNGSLEPQTSHRYLQDFDAVPLPQKHMEDVSKNEIILQILFIIIIISSFVLGLSVFVDSLRCTGKDGNCRGHRDRILNTVTPNPNPMHKALGPLGQWARSTL